MTQRPLSEIAAEIRADWTNVHYTAEPYLDAMAVLDRVDGYYYGEDDARGVVLYFLSNAGTWRGETARRIKAELKGMVK